MAIDDDHRLPDFFLTLCAKIYQTEFQPDCPNWTHFEEALKQANSNGLDRFNCFTVMVGIRACQDWDDSSEREHRLTQFQYSAERSRGTVAFSERAERRRVFTEDWSERVFSLLVLGYAQACGFSGSKRVLWFPLYPALKRIITPGIRKDQKDPDPDRRSQISEAMRLRIFRLKDPEAKKLPTAIARDYFSQVYATLFD